MCTLFDQEDHLIIIFRIPLYLTHNNMSPFTLVESKRVFLLKMPIVFIFKRKLFEVLDSFLFYFGAKLLSVHFSWYERTFGWSR